MPMHADPTPAMFKVAMLMLAMLMLAGLAGCQAPIQPTGPTELRIHVLDYDQFIDSTLSLLRLQDFPPRRVDRAGGLIETGPATSGQWFEFWRSDSPGGYQVFESSIHTLRREVTIRLRPANTSNKTSPGSQSEHGLENHASPGGETRATPDGAAASAPAEETLKGLEPPSRPAGDYIISIEVVKSRFSAPERQVTTASGALAIYSERLPTTEGLRASKVRNEHWIPLGRDVLLENLLLDRILERLPVTDAMERSESAQAG